MWERRVLKWSGRTACDLLLLLARLWPGIASTITFAPFSVRSFAMETSRRVQGRERSHRTPFHCPYDRARTQNDLWRRRRFLARRTMAFFSDRRTASPCPSFGPLDEVWAPTDLNSVNLFGSFSSVDARAPCTSKQSIRNFLTNSLILLDTHDTYRT